MARLHRHYPLAYHDVSLATPYRFPFRWRIGISRFVSRTPHMITSKVGLSKKSNDPELDEYTRNFEVMEKAVEALLKDSKIFAEAVITILESGSKFAEGFSNLFHPMVGEYDIIGKYPEAAKTAKNVDKYANSMQELRETLRPELDLIETRIVAPTRDFQGLVKTIRKNITKREHKLVDYDRHNNSLTKLRDKKEKSLNDEKNLFKMPPPPPTGSSYAAKRANSALPPPSAAASSSAPPPPYTPGNGPAVAIAAATKRPPPPPPSKAKKPAAPQPTYVIAMYDFSAQADGDLDFKTGDQIEVLQRTGSTEDWWKGRLNGREGVFPGNYVRDA
ncbi:hypothetical protein FRB91_011253 [Serendipita sp. 411]|nr:hypothetical protein FRB91_011253 [Serendipita sp. 411]